MIDTTGKCSACGQTVGIDTIHTCSPQVTAPTPERRVVERLTCSCPDWASGTEAINGPIIEKAVRSGLTWQFTGKKFRFCPWCGKALAPPAPEAELVARIVLEGGSVKADFVPPFSAPPAPEGTDG